MRTVWLVKVAYGNNIPRDMALKSIYSSVEAARAAAESYVREPCAWTDSNALIGIDGNPRVAQLEEWVVHDFPLAALED